MIFLGKKNKGKFSVGTLFPLFKNAEEMGYSVSYYS